MKLFVVSEIEVVNISTSSYCFTDLNFLLLCRIYFRFEALLAISTSLSICFYTYEVRTTYKRTHGVLKQYPARVLLVVIVLHCSLPRWSY